MISLPPGTSLCVIILENEVLGSVRGTLLASRPHELKFVVVPTHPVHPVSPSGTCKSSGFIQGLKQPFFMSTLNTRGFQRASVADTGLFCFLFSRPFPGLQRFLYGTGFPGRSMNENLQAPASLIGLTIWGVAEV